MFATSGLGGMIGWVLVHVSFEEEDKENAYATTLVLTLRNACLKACKYNCCAYESC